ncbi:MAG: methionyl-tRNA formyltransferase [Lachnospiraceae bacterium]|nr:methionyl-tRNA formyltransferase [Lachnospiraceae bacterium]
MRIIFMGTPDFAVGSFEALLKSNHEVVLAVTQPDRQRGRGNKVTYSPVKEVALEHGIEVFQPKKVKDAQSVEVLKSYQPDLIVVVAFGQILSKEILDLPAYGCINVHGSLLPKYRGAAPIQWAVLDGEEVTGVTTMRMDEGLDTGDIIMKKEYTLTPEETAGSLFDHLMGLGATTLMETIDAIEKGTATYTPQNHSEATKTRMISKEMGKMNFNRSAVELERHVRGMSPWPSAYCKLKGKTLKVWKCTILDEVDGETKADPEAGEIIKVDKHNIYVNTGQGILRFDEVQLEGKRRMSCEDFLRGYQVETGIVL